MEAVSKWSLLQEKKVWNPRSDMRINKIYLLITFFPLYILVLANNFCSLNICWINDHLKYSLYISKPFGSSFISSLWWIIAFCYLKIYHLCKRTEYVYMSQKVECKYLKDFGNIFQKSLTKMEHAMMS
jgi:hypothetical protein